MIETIKKEKNIQKKNVQTTGNLGLAFLENSQIPYNNNWLITF
jgi:hypothetical protein